MWERYARLGRSCVWGGKVGKSKVKQVINSDGGEEKMLGRLCRFSGREGKQNWGGHVCGEERERSKVRCGGEEEKRCGYDGSVVWLGRGKCGGGYAGSVGEKRARLGRSCVW